MNETYHRHITELADANSVEIVWKENYPGRASKKPRRIKIPPIKTATTYALALHELGHIVGRQVGCRIDREVQAWQWAKENALEWRKPMKKKAARCLQSYLDWAERRNGVIKPTPDHPIHKWITR
jgi:hypothetical protein